MTQRWLFLLYLTIVSDMIASAISAFSLWRFSKTNGYSKLVRLLAAVFAAFFFQQFCLLIANTFGYQVKPVYTLGFGWSHWIGRGVLSVALWTFTLYMLGHRSSPPKE